jgi:2-polyprenyl-6-methoxyphenol hydroxylase-like FAD-dependent oxidoreductase
MKDSHTFTIIGGGIAGLTTAIALQRLGIQVTIFEATSVVRSLGAGLLLAANAMQAFDRLGIAHEVVVHGRQLDAFAILDQQGHIITRTDTHRVSMRYGIHNFTIHRADLHQVLLNQLPSNAIRTGKRAIGLTEQPDGVTVHFEDGTSHQTDYLLVADGIHSPLRGQLLADWAPRYAGYTCWRAVVHWPGNTFHEATETWGSQGRMGIVPLANDQVYWFACVNAPLQDPQMRQQTTSDLAKRFASYHTPIPDLLTHNPDQGLLWNDIIDLKPLARYAFGRTLLLGDAAHATTPNMGQGACQAIEDAVVLADELKRHQMPQQAFVGFEARRLVRTHYITNTSWRLGQIAQTTNPLLVSLRNGVLRRLPKRLIERQLETLFEVDF